ncbi:MAG: hypothetical protein HY900_04845 [Deltaproteobacteria bacterium]|nr:hypothetical protein [Deltaproteobacteria bacterium]
MRKGGGSVPRKSTRYDVDPERGFLPRPDPLRRLPARYSAWEALAAELPKVFAAGALRRHVEALPLLDPSPLRTRAELERAMLLLSYFGHGYVWGGKEPAAALPRVLAMPWHAVALRLGRPPVLSYASYALSNWRRLDPEGPIELGNVVLLQNFLGGLDEEWFVLVHIDIEAKAAPALRAIPRAQAAVRTGDARALEAELGEVARALEAMDATLDRMPERCDPYVYYHRVRPYLHGWKDHPALPEGVVYEGVEEYGGRPVAFRGETGAQTGLVPCLDAALGIVHREDELRHFLTELRRYMPPSHLAFVEAVEAGPSIRGFVAGRSAQPGLKAAYNGCVELLGRFRTRHVEYAGRYIQLQAQRDAKNPTTVGTGGTPFVPYLRKHRDETAEHLLS